TLSGGERNRLLLAKLFTRPTNVLVMDEPTNDLDIETLELLEELLLEYTGTLLLVSHDRSFVNNLVTSTIAFEGNGRLEEYVGGYDDWIKQRKLPTGKNTKSKSSSTPKATNKKEPEAQQVEKKLSYKERIELEKLPQQIETLETDIEAIHAEMASADFYKLSQDKMTEIQKNLADNEQQLSEFYKRWEALE
ncbi:MAG: ABC transporter ATP-binding protein, partial [Thiotrichaceae bacterium]